MTPDAPEGTVTSELHALTQPDPRTISWEHKLWRRRAEQLWPQRLQNITVIHRRVPHDGKRPAPRHRRCLSATNQRYAQGGLALLALLHVATSASATLCCRIAVF